MNIINVASMNLVDQIVFVRIQTDAGIEGIGEVSPIYPRIICAIVNEIIAPILADQNPFEIERLYDRLLYSRPGQFCNYKLGPGGALTSAICGVEIALWDIMGKALGQPVYALLGGLYRRHVPVFASMALTQVKTPDAWASRARNFVDQGYGGVKVVVGSEWGFESGADDPVKTIESVRNSIGDDVDLIADAHNAYYPHTASRIAREFEAFGVFHFEEPIAAHDWDGMARIRGQTLTPIAAGE